MPQKVYPVAHRYGMLRPIEYRWGEGWVCECDCGAVTTVTGGNLRAGNVISCGCHRREKARQSIRVAVNRNLERTKRGELWGVFKLRADGVRYKPRPVFLLTAHKQRRKGTPCWVCRVPCRGTLCAKCSGSATPETVNSK